MDVPDIDMDQQAGAAGREQGGVLEGGRWIAARRRRARIATAVRDFAAKNRNPAARPCSTRPAPPRRRCRLGVGRCYRAVVPPAWRGPGGPIRCHSGGRAPAAGFNGQGSVP